MQAKLEVGALTESVTVTTEAALLKTDKADVSVNLKPADVVNLPLNQYRNYQGLMNLVPGATPVGFQNAQTDTPGRSLTTNVNGTNRNNNVTRIDGAASINVWLPHHAGYIAPVETIETVNISTNSFDASQGMTGGAAVSVATKSGTNEIKGSAFYFRNQDELERAPGLLLGGRQPGVERRHPRRHRRRPDHEEPPVLLRWLGAQHREEQPHRQLTVPTAKMRTGDFSEVLGVQLRTSASTIRRPATSRRVLAARSSRARRFRPTASARSRRTSRTSIRCPTRPAPTTASRTTTKRRRFPEATRDNVDFKVNWNRTSANQIWGKYSMMDATVMDLFYLPFDEPGGGDTKVNLWSDRPDLHASRRPSSGTPRSAPTRWTTTRRGLTTAPTTGLDVFGIPGTNSAGVTGPGSSNPSTTRASRSSTPASRAVA